MVSLYQRITSLCQSVKREMGSFTGRTRATGLIEDDMARVADANEALERLWMRLETACRRPRLTRDDIDDWSNELALIESGLAAGKRGLRVRRERV